MEFIVRLRILSRLCFVDEPIKANNTIVVEFYSNALETNFGREVAIMILEVGVDFSLAAINAIYGLSDADNRKYRERYQELCT